VSGETPLERGEMGLDSRAIERLLGRTYGLAETALDLGARTAEATVRDARLPDSVKMKLVPIYGEQALRLTLLYAGAGLAICEVVQAEALDDGALAQLESYRARLSAIKARARAALDDEFPGSRVLGLP
jgi:hypothetical protein